MEYNLNIKSDPNIKNKYTMNLSLSLDHHLSNYIFDSISYEIEDGFDDNDTYYANVLNCSDSINNVLYDMLSKLRLTEKERFDAQDELKDLLIFLKYEKPVDWSSLFDSDEDNASEELNEEITDNLDEDNILDNDESLNNTNIQEQTTEEVYKEDHAENNFEDIKSNKDLSNKTSEINTELNNNYEDEIIIN